MDLRHVFNCMISVSELGRGQASKVIQAIEETGNPYIIIKNNKPQAVIISIEDYMDYQRSRDLLTAMQMYNPVPAPAQSPDSPPASSPLHPGASTGLPSEQFRSSSASVSASASPQAFSPPAHLSSPSTAAFPSASLPSASPSLFSSGELTAPIPMSTFTQNLTHDELSLFMSDEEGD